MTTTRPRRVATCLVAIIALALPGCLEDGPPDWWEFEKRPEGSSITGVRDGQVCTPEEETPPADSLRLHFIDVGQGDAIWVQTPTGENILIDAGDGGFFDRTDGGEVVEAYLTRAGLPPGAALDAAFVTHAHSDHYGGFIHLLNRYAFEDYIDPGLDTTGISYGNLVSSAGSKVGNFLRPAIDPEGGGIATRRGGEIATFGTDVRAWILHAEGSTRAVGNTNEKTNNTSIVLKLQFAGRNVMLTGDIHAEVERELLARYLDKPEEPRISDIHLLKIAHHGSNTSSTILDALYRDTPFDERYGVIQSGRLTFGSTTLPRKDTVFRIWSYLNQDQLFSTEADDVNKDEGEAAGDDNILAVIQRTGEMYVCYRAQEPSPFD